MAQNIIKEKFTKLKIPKLLNLEEIGEEYAMSVQEIVDFHNKHCKLPDLLTVNIPKYVEYLYLPTEKCKIRQAQLLKSTRLSLPQTISNKTYGIQLKFPASDLKIHYRIDVNRSIEGTVRLFKQKTFINNYEVEHPIEQLAETAISAIFPLLLLLNGDGSVKHIINQEEIKRRWNDEALPELSKYYVGEVADHIIKKINQYYSNLNDATLFFERNIFFYLFFLPVYRHYPDFSLAETLYFYFTNIDFRATYSVVFSLEKQFTQSNRIALRITGEEVPGIFKKGNKKGKIDLLYKFHKESYEIFSITGKATCFYGDNECVAEIEIFDLINSR